MTNYEQTGADATTVTAASRASLTQDHSQIPAFNTGPDAMQVQDHSRMDVSNLIFNPNPPPTPNPNAFKFFGDALNQQKTKPLFG